MASKIVPFGFPDTDDFVAPSVMNSRIGQRQKIIAVLLAGLFTSMVLHLVTLPMVFSTADAEAYVADGGVFGCRVTVLPSASVR